MALWNQPLVVAAALGLGLLLNPAGNAGIGSYRIAVTPPELIGRVQSTIAVRVDVRDAALPDPGRRAARHARRRPRAILVLGAPDRLVALIPTLVPLGPSGAEARAWDRYEARVPVAA